MDELIKEFTKIDLNDNKLDELCDKLDKLTIDKEPNNHMSELCSLFVNQCMINKCSKEKVLSVMDKIFKILLDRKGRCYVNDNKYIPSFVY